MRIAVLISGYGSNLQAIIDAIENGVLPEVQIVAVVSNRLCAYGLKRARQHGIPALYYRYSLWGRRQDSWLANLLKDYDVDLVVLAGWMCILSSDFLQHYGAINLHPALPGQFSGLNAIERAFEAYQRGEITETGVMVHYVVEKVDAGPVIMSETVPIYTTDNIETLTERIHQAEHRVLVESLSLLVERLK